MDTLDNIELIDGVWTDLYDKSGVDVGARINVENIGSISVYLYSGASAPGGIPGPGWRRLFPGDEKINDSGDAGAWALSTGQNGLVNVKEVV